MSVDITVSMPNLPEMVGRLKAFRQDQLPFALSLAMNRAAKDARDGVRAHMRGRFNLESENFHRTFGPFGALPSAKARTSAQTSEMVASKGVANGWSHRTQWPNLRVVLGSVAYAAALQEQGGNKPFSGAKDGVAAGGGGGTKPSRATARHAWIPTKYLPREGRRVARNFQPARIRQRLKATRRGTKATDTVWQEGKYVMRRPDGSSEARPIYILATRAVVRPALDYARFVQDTYNAKLWPRFSQAMDSALKSARNNRFSK